MQIKSLADGVLSIIKTDGLGGLFVGYYATLVRDLPYTVDSKIIEVFIKLIFIYVWFRC